MTKEAAHAIDFLAENPFGHTTVDAGALRSILLESGSRITGGGCLYDVVASNIGAGMYKMSLRRVS